MGWVAVIGTIILTLDGKTFLQVYQQISTVQKVPRNKPTALIKVQRQTKPYFDEEGKSFPSVGQYLQLLRYFGLILLRGFLCVAFVAPHGHPLWMSV
jgi:hypothetical protein